MARKRRRRRAKPGSLEQLTAVLWRTVLEVEALLNEEDCPPERVLRCAHALAQLSGAYRSVTEVVAIEQRIRALEMAAERNGNP
jgi:hypothetical protein